MIKKVYHIGSFLLLLLLACSTAVFSQYDLKAEWNEYEAGIITDDDPFFGSFTITNNGESVISAGDTIWYGYLIDGDLYDKELNIGLVSGIVLEEDFSAGDERSIYNPIIWPLWGSGDSIEVCATVFGVGVESYTGDYFTGDSDPENNSTCVTAVLPIYVSDMDEKHNTQDFSTITIQANQGLIQLKLMQELSVPVEISIIGIAGNVVLQKPVLPKGQTELYLNYPSVPSGIYFIRMSWSNGVIAKKIFIRND